MAKKMEEINALFSDFESKILEEEKRDDSTDEDFSLNELDVFQLISLFRTSIYPLKQMRILERTRYVVLTLSLEELIAALATSPIDSEIGKIISSRLVKVLEERIDDNKLNIGDLKTICSFLGNDKVAIRLLDSISIKKFGYSLMSNDFNVALQGYKKEMMGRRQSLSYALFNLILKHNPCLEDDELFPLRSYLAKIIIDNKSRPTFQEAFSMWQKSARFPELEHLFRDIMVDDVISISSMTPCNKLPGWFLSALSNREKLPAEVALELVKKINDFRLFKARGVTGDPVINVETKETFIVSDDQEEVGVRAGLWAGFKTELLSRLGNVFGCSTRVATVPNVNCAH